MASSWRRILCALLGATALLLGSAAAPAAPVGPPAPGPIDPCVLEPSSCPPQIDPPGPPPQIQVPFEPLFFGIYKLKVKGAWKHEASEAFDPDLPQFPDIVLGTEEGYALPGEIVVDPVKFKMKLAFGELAVPIFEAWLAHRIHGVTAGSVVVSLAGPPKVRLKEKKNEDYAILKLKVKGTATLDGVEHSFRYKGVVIALGLGSP